MEKQFRITEEGLQFGATIDTRPLSFILAEDLNKKIIKIPYRDDRGQQETTIEQLIKNYLEITSCRKLITQRPCFRIMNGSFKGEIAVQSFKLINIELDLASICFRVENFNNIDMEQSFYLTIKKVKSFKIQQKINLKLIHNGTTFEITININEKIIQLKKLLLSNKQFQNKSPDMIDLNFRGKILVNQNNISDYQGIGNNSQITAVIIKRQGCTNNMFINIIFTNKSKNDIKYKEQINIKQTENINNILKTIEDQYQEYHANHLKLVCSGKQLKKFSTLSNYNIKKQSDLNLVIKTSEMFNFLHPDTEIMVKNGAKMIKDIIIGDQVATCSFNKGEIEYDRVVQNTKKEINQFYKITFTQSNKTLNILPDSYLELSNGDVKTIDQIYQLFKQKQKILLKKYNGGQVQIAKLKNFSIKSEYFKLTLEQSGNYILQSQIIIHNEVIHLMVKLEQIQNICLGVGQKTYIRQIKQKIGQFYKVDIDKFNLFYKDKKLDSNRMLREQSIGSEHLITVNAYQPKKSKIMAVKQEQQKQTTKIWIKTSQTEKHAIQYQTFAEKTIQDIIKQILPNCKSAYFLIFAQLIVLPFQKLSKIRESDQFNQSQNTVLMVNNGKMPFIMNMNIQGEDIKSHSHINNGNLTLVNFKEDEELIKDKFYKAAQKRIQSSNLEQLFKQKQFYRPFLYYTSNKYKNQINEFIRHFHQNFNKIQQPQQKFLYDLIKSLYIHMTALPLNLDSIKIPSSNKDARNNYIEYRALKEVYFGLRNFKLSSFYKRNQTFYWYGFITACNDISQIRQELKDQSGTLFHIVSTTGKKISQLSINLPRKLLIQKTQINYQQILFSPYTYFLINKIQHREQMDEVWLTEIASPNSFQKDILLWVDDQPINNFGGVVKIQKEKDIQILQLVSTLSAQKWLKQFGWILIWKNINFRLISDLKRREYSENSEEIVQNQQAGFSLLHKIYVECCLTVKSRIFCSDQKFADEKLKQSPYNKIRNHLNKDFEITHHGKKILEFAKYQDDQ